MLQPNPSFINEVISLVNSSPFPTHMSMRLASIGLDTSDIEITLGQNHLQPFGLVHGGVFATIIDTATFWSVFMRIPEDAGLVNVDLKLNYLGQVREGVLQAEGKAVRNGNSISYAEARVYDGQGELVAHGTSTLMILPGKGLQMKNRKFLPG